MHVPVENDDVTRLSCNQEYLHGPAPPLALNTTHLVEDDNLVVCRSVLGAQTERRGTYTEREREREREGGREENEREGKKKVIKKDSPADLTRRCD